MVLMKGEMYARIAIDIAASRHIRAKREGNSLSGLAFVKHKRDHELIKEVIYSGN
jgi:hypothetical protein